MDTALIGSAIGAVAKSLSWTLALPPAISESNALIKRMNRTPAKFTLDLLYIENVSANVDSTGRNVDKLRRNAKNGGP